MNPYALLVDSFHTSYVHYSWLLITTLNFSSSYVHIDVDTTIQYLSWSVSVLEQSSIDIPSIDYLTFQPTWFNMSIKPIGFDKASNLSIIHMIDEDKEMNRIPLELPCALSNAHEVTISLVDED